MKQEEKRRNNALTTKELPIKLLVGNSLPLLGTRQREEANSWNTSGSLNERTLHFNFEDIMKALLGTRVAAASTHFTLGHW